MANENYSLGIGVETSGAERALASLDKGITTLTRNSEKFSKGASQATNALSNLSRVVQDAPFGFMGIANNLNPLVESFQRLKKETGSTGGALKALLAGLTGPAGIGLAIGTVSALLVKYGDDLFATAGALYDNTKALQEYNDQMAKAAGNAQGEIAQVNALVGIVKNETLTREQRNSALEQLQEMYPAYFNNQGIDINNTNALTAATNSLTAAIQRKAEAQALQNLITEEYTKKAKLEQQGALGTTTVLDGLISYFKGAGQAGSVTTELITGKVNQYNDALKQSKTNIEALTAKLNALTTTQTVNGDKVDKGTQKTQKQTSAIVEQVDWVRKLQDEYYKLFMARARPEQAQAVTSGFNEFRSQNLQPGLAGQGGIQNAPMVAGMSLFRIEQDALDRMSEGLQKNTEWAAALKTQLAGVAVDGFEAMINAATAADASFETISKALLNVIKQLAIAAAKALIFKAILGAATGGAGVVAGSATGGSFLGKIFGFATGGIVTGPTPAMIGEGTEAEAVMPLSQLQNVIDMNSGGNGYIADTRISGADLLLMIRRATQSGAFSGTSFG